jgi:ATP-dependent Clp protease ATP-binding subunit ClpX
MVKQYERLFEMEGVELKFTDEALKTIVKKAIKRKTGARSLRAIMEEAMLDIMFSVPSMPNLASITITPEVVLEKEEPKYEFSSSKRSA